jgi:hypothetical protein
MKKVYHKLIVCLLLTFLAAGVFAQQGNVAAGGDATGAGGSMSYSIGQVDYLYHSSDQGSLNFGLQQPFLHSPPLVLEIPNTTVHDGELLCFNAEQTVTVAGDGKHFIVEAHGHADIIAGINIIMKHGTSVQYGGSLHAYISDVFCDPPESLLASFEVHIQPELLFEPVLKETFFKVYPNPTTGDFTLELLNVEEASLLLVEIYTMQGHLITSNVLPSKPRHNLSLAGRQPGVYLIRVLNGLEVGTTKIIKQQ